MIGLTIGHYRVVQRLGAGGMGEVYLARDLQLDRDVALKLLPSGTIGDDSARRQFRQEAVALAKLNHPNIATVYEFNTHDGIDFIAMELIAGSTLLQKIEHGALPQAEVLQLGIQLADGLAIAHA